jgi:hypothetical protein
MISCHILSLNKINISDYELLSGGTKCLQSEAYKSQMPGHVSN